MADSLITQKLSIPRIMGTDFVMRDGVNRAIDHLDGAVLPLAHAAERLHFDLWRPGTAYKKYDVVRTTACPSWGFYMCVNAGTSALAEPRGYGEGDIETDGTVTWILKRFGGAAGSAIDYWYADKVYEKGQLVLHQRFMYMSNAAHTSAAHFDPTKWTLLNVGYLPDWRGSATYERDMLVVRDGNVYRCLTYHAAAADFAADAAKWELVVSRGALIGDWQSGKAYARHETVYENNCLYRANVGHVAGAAITEDRANWELLTQRKTLIDDWTAEAEYEAEECVLYHGHMYRAKAAHTASAAFSDDAANWQLVDTSYLPDWQPNTPYRQDETVWNQGTVYRAKTAHTSGAGFLPTNWEEVGGAGVTRWQAGKHYTAGQVVLRNGLLYACAAAH